MRVLNEIDRFHLVISAISSLNLGTLGDEVISQMERMLKKHYDYIREYGEDMPEVTDFKF